MPDEAPIFGKDLFGKEIRSPYRGVVSERFLFPPFTILDGRQGEWQNRKRAWIAMGIQGELGRGKDLLKYSDTVNRGRKSWGSLVHAIPLRRYDSDNMDEEYYGDEAQRLNTSIFDPVLCEICYRWWSPEGGQIVDPFAGGSVRGIVAQAMGRPYWGCDLSHEQIEANKVQAGEIGLGYPLPVWICGDSMNTLDEAPVADFIFSCPPYGNLEVYSDDPADLSNMEQHTFVAAYKRIILRVANKLKDNRFACFVVGDFRDKLTGFYRNFVGMTIAAFREQGLHLYNEAILVSMVGSASMRINRQFESGRKLAKTHQNVLVFCKGDWREASRVCRETAPKTETPNLTLSPGDDRAIVESGGHPFNSREDK